MGIERREMPYCGGSPHFSVIVPACLGLMGCDGTIVESMVCSFVRLMRLFYCFFIAFVMPRLIVHGSNP